MSVRFPILVCGLISTLVPDVRADLVATYQIWHGGGQAGIIESITQQTYLSEEFAVVDGLGTLFEDIVLFDGDTRVDIANETVDSDFVDFAQLITDGLDWWLYKKMDFAFGARIGFNLESLLLEFVDPDHPGVDLSGYIVDSVTRTITVELDSPGSDPGGDGNWTDFLVTGVYEIYGSPIPEPASLVVLALGSAAVFVRRRRKHRACHAGNR